MSRHFAGMTLVHLVWASIGGLVLLGCGSDTTSPTPAKQLLWTLSLNVHAANMALVAPYDTMQLTAIPRTPSGTPLSDTATAQYSTKDSAISVSPTGLVTAHYLTSRARVIAQVSAGGLTAVDTTIIQVVDASSAAPLTSFSVQPRPGDFASKRAPLYACENYFYTPCPFVPVYATLATGSPATDTVCNGNMYGCTPLLVSFRTSDARIATVDQYGAITPNHVGRVTLYASAWAFGVIKQDSLLFSVGYGDEGYSNVHMDTTRNPAVLTLQRDTTHLSVHSVGTVWRIDNATSDLLEVTLPTPGVHFVVDDYSDNDYGFDIFVPAQPVTQLKDTLETTWPKTTTFVEFDSAGTYTLHYRRLTSGDTTSFSLVIRDYP